MERLIFILALSTLPASCWGMNTQQTKIIHRIKKCTLEIKQAKEKVKVIETMIDQCKPLSTDLLLKKELWEVIENSWTDTDLTWDFEDFIERKNDYRQLKNDEIIIAKNRIIYLANTRLIFTKKIREKQAELQRLKKCLSAK